MCSTSSARPGTGKRRCPPSRGRSSASAPATRWTTSCGRSDGCRQTPAPRRARPWRPPAAAGRPPRTAPRRPASRSTSPTMRRAVPRARSATSARRADERVLVEIDQPIESHLERRIELRDRQRLARAEEVHVDEQQSGLDARDVEREQARRPQAERRSRARDRVPHRAGVVAVHPDLVAEVAGVAGPRNLDRLGRAICPVVTRKYLRSSMSASATGAEQRRPTSAPAARAPPRARRCPRCARRVRPPAGRIHRRFGSAAVQRKRSSASRLTVPSSTTWPCSLHHGV